MADASKPFVISAPEPRTLELIFSPEKLAELRARYELYETDAASVAGLDDARIASLLERGVVRQHDPRSD